MDKSGPWQKTEQLEEVVKELMGRTVLNISSEGNFHDYVIDNYILDSLHDNIQLMSGGRHLGTVTLEQAHLLLDGGMLDVGECKISLAPCIIDLKDGWLGFLD